MADLPLAFATLSVHADASDILDIAPPIHVSTTYRYADDWTDRTALKNGWISAAATPKPAVPHPRNPALPETELCYSRMHTTTRDRLETVLGALDGGSWCRAVTYASGLAAVTAALAFCKPKRIIMSRQGYHGSHAAVDVYARGRESLVVHIEDGMPVLEDGDLVWLESPRNPRGEISDVRAVAASRPKSGKVYVIVDSTFAPPPLQKCLEVGADIVMHSSTKYLAGHSDALGGVLVAKDPAVAEGLLKDRIALGGVLGNMEAWLLLRSLRSLNVRVKQQSATATAISAWLNSRIAGKDLTDPSLEIIKRVWHGSIEGNPGHEVAVREGWGWSGTISLEFTSLHHARLICDRLRLFTHATSLGGCESLIEWRVSVDSSMSPRLVRISFGLEDPEDLKADLRRGFLEVKKEVDALFAEGWVEPKEE
ncbi:Cys/Met metabolism PLP-dependent enzyme-domain-containing protein [Blyttiomyces helicus]|uniref:Cys/Met metabolism PLP-dependent enzyme-domain-containing protein n=1 Tax=Blyttiomyces helicus TaxID=388810 RepID=A0A4P9WEJ0_9FUNG|nr:Cys/Met metabolism PLP-dependent enzyme-domain-containing protein [Blyttiomyces helicus]|eukprot:RKO91139.1 Cys/Met metabolism PLP-dependent enzyme-domain-containing protein [Blyttiomyces helicus]